MNSLGGFGRLGSSSSRSLSLGGLSGFNLGRVKLMSSRSSGLLGLIKW